MDIKTVLKFWLVLKETSSLECHEFLCVTDLYFKAVLVCKISLQKPLVLRYFKY